MDEGVKKELDRLGFVVEPGSRAGYFRISKETVPDVDHIIKLLRAIPFEKSISFWNYYHQTISDPGSYVTAVIVGDHAVYMEGNHGWSSDYKRISFEELAELIQKNWDKDCDWGKYLNAVFVEPHRNSERDRKFMYML